jgi:hypothetical protein
MTDRDLSPLLGGGPFGAARSKFVDRLLADTDMRLSHWDPEQAAWIPA